MTAKLPLWCGLRSPDSESIMFFSEVWPERKEKSWVIAGPKLRLKEGVVGLFVF